MVGIPTSALEPFGLAQLLRRRLFDLDLYVASGGGGSYGWHFDAHDSLLICVGGRKRMRVAAAAARPGDQRPVEIDARMRPGDVVFIPAGCYHCGHDDLHDVDDGLDDRGGDESDGGCTREDGRDGRARTVSVLLSIGLASEHRAPRLIADDIERHSARWQGADFFTGRALDPLADEPDSRAKRRRTL